MTTSEKIVTVFTLLAFFTATANYAISSVPWLALIPGISAFSQWNILYDKTNVDMYRYGDWFLTRPLMLLAILLQNNLTSSYIHIILILDMLSIGCGYFSTKETDKTKKLYWFILSLALLLPVIYVLYTLTIERPAALFLLVTWLIYPIIYLLRFTNILREGPTNILYTLLDLITKLGLLENMHI
jgi:bacteriorhodopsin